MTETLPAFLAAVVVTPARARPGPARRSAATTNDRIAILRARSASARSSVSVSVAAQHGLAGLDRVDGEGAPRRFA